MIKKLFTAALLTIAVAVNAQELKTSFIPKGIKIEKNLVNARQINHNNIATLSADTMYPASLLPAGCAPLPNGPYYYYPWGDNVIDTGYIFGSNTYTQTILSVTYTVQLQESAQKYYVSGMGSVTGVLIPTPIASSTSANTMITANIYSENTATKGPLTSLGSSTPKALNSFSTTSLNMLNFGTPVSLSSQNFFASIVCPKQGGPNMDMLALLATSAGTCPAPNYMSDSLSWVKQVVAGFTPTWISVANYFQGQNVDLLIFPVLDLSLSTASVSQGDLSLFAASPNPAANSININFSLNTSSKVSIDIYDLTGKVIRTVKNNDLFQPGKHAVSLDLNDLAPGSYLYSIHSGVSKMAGKFVVTK